VSDNIEVCSECSGTGQITIASKLDYDYLYYLYPKKGPGKKKGMRKLATQVKSQKKYDEVLLAIKNLLRLNRENKFYPNFDTFLNNYEDYLDMKPTPKYQPYPEPAVAEEPASPEVARESLKTMKNLYAPKAIT